jgi:hypothetical protein
MTLIRAHLVVDHSDNGQLLTYRGNVAAAWLAGHVGALLTL